MLEEYEVAVSELERKLKDVSIHLNMEDIRETLSSRYERSSRMTRQNVKMLRLRLSRSSSTTPSIKSEGRTTLNTREVSKASVGIAARTVTRRKTAGKGKQMRRTTVLRKNAQWVRLTMQMMLEDCRRYFLLMLMLLLKRAYGDYKLDQAT